MGLVGQLAGQILRAAGCTVIGVDLSQELLDLASASGAADRVFQRQMIERSLRSAADCDAVLVTAATSTSDPVGLASRLCRDRGRVVIVGDVGLNLDRAAFYAKELELRLSRSYGPGRYDREYEERGLDYPIGYVRWTERRNLAAFVELLATGRVDVEPLITERVSLRDASAVYDGLAMEDGSPLGIVFVYDAYAGPEIPPVKSSPRPAGSRLRTGVIGTGSFAQRVLLPCLRTAGFELAAVASASGLSAQSAADRFGLSRARTPKEVITDPEVDVLVVATRHASHADLAVAALAEGKHVFVEKPPALNQQELDRLADMAEASGRRLVVGFNRRHAELGVSLRDHVRAAGKPIDLLYRVNAGPLPADHWLNDLEEGGGRLLGEGCHFVDFACWVIGDVPRSVTAAVGEAASGPLAAAQSFVVTLDFEDGSLATILYSAGGAGRLDKEYVEAHAGGWSAVLADFRHLRLYAGDRRGRQMQSRRGKGHQEEFADFRRLIVEGGAAEAPSPLATMAVTLAALRAASTGSAVEPVRRSGV
jgi:predicted dehydrogenase